MNVIKKRATIEENFKRETLKESNEVQSAWDIFRSIKKPTLGPKDPELLKEAIFLLQGSRGKIFSSSLDSKLCSSTRQILSECHDLGSKLKRIESFCRVTETASSGLVVKTFKNSVFELLQEYTRFLALLEEMVLERANITILHVLSLSRKKGQILEALNQIITKTDCSTGHKVISSLMTLTNTGNPDMFTLSKKILAESGKPWIKELAEWLHKGHIAENNSDFFISANKESNDIWRTKFAVDTAKYLNSFPSELNLSVRKYCLL